MMMKGKRMAERYGAVYNFCQNSSVLSSSGNDITYTSQYAGDPEKLLMGV
jgi:hypothetical protein